ncbi:MAG: ankyrin repeat domain-containing protein [Alphaproteobacteria bacterium]
MVTRRAHLIPLGAMAAFISLGVGLMTGPVSALTVTRSAFDPINGLVHHVQVAPTAPEIAAYDGLLAAAAAGDSDGIRALVATGANIDVRDSRGRTPLMVAVYGRHHAALKTLIDLDADDAALDNQRYDAITIASVIDDPVSLRMLIEAGADAGLMTSPYDGTALIAAAHLGHVAVVRERIAAGAPLDHLNNLGWTALIEAIVLGDGGVAHTDVVRDLIEVGADLNLPDRRGVTPLGLARARGYDTMARLLEAAGAAE